MTGNSKRTTERGEKGEGRVWQIQNASKPRSVPATLLLGLLLDMRGVFFRAAWDVAELWDGGQLAKHF